MNQEPIDFLSDRIPVGITKEMVYKAIIDHIYLNILTLGSDVRGILDVNKRISNISLGLYEFNRPLTTGEATTYFINQYMGDV